MPDWTSWACSAALGPRRLACLAALIALLGGCRTPPMYIPPGLPAFMKEDIAVGDPPPRPGFGEPQPLAEPLGPPNPPPVAPSAPLPAQVSLPEAIQETVLANLRIQAGSEKVRQAQADLLTAGLIPNAQLYLDSQLNPFNKFFPTRQGGPPQYDAYVNMPIDWYLFGKRVAAQQANKLGVDVAAADLADLVRVRVADTIAAYYDVLEAKALLTLARQDLAALQRIEEITKQQVQAGGAGTLDLERARLAVVDSKREERRRQVVLVSARSRLRPMLGRSSLDPAFEVEGDLDIAAFATPPELIAAMELAEKNRPDLISDVREIEKAKADVESERRKAYPQVWAQGMFTYQVQQTTIGYPDARSWGVALTSTLPFTDRNQGNINKARSNERQLVATYRADVAEVRAEVEQALEAYRVILAVVSTDDPASLEAARQLRDGMEQAYRIGGRRLLEVLDAQRTYRDRLRTITTNKADYWRALNRLNAAIGSRVLE